MSGRLVVPVALAIVLSMACIGCWRNHDARAASLGEYAPIALAMADSLLARQNADGVIPDAPGRNTANEDSTMEYALIGLAAAGRHTGDARFLLGLERGIRWLAEREEMADPLWRGSWFFAFSTTSPYAPVPVSPGPGVRDVRGVSATSALFVYLLYLHSTLSGSDVLVTHYEPHAKAALDFILTRNRGKDGFFNSSWHRRESDGQWHQWAFQYAADQGDVYLGLTAGWLLYKDARYRDASWHLSAHTESAFFDAGRGRYAMGRDENGDRETEMEGFNGIFSQGYLPWIWGKSGATEAAGRWLSSCGQPDGGMVCYPGDPGYSMSAALHGLAAASLGYPLPTKSLNWVIERAYDPKDGGVRDTAASDSEKYSNVAGFTIAALLGFLPLER